MNSEIRKIITDEETLSEISSEIDVRNQMKLMRNIISDIKQVIRKENIKSLSAPCIGYKYRIFCINYSDTEIKTYINPVIVGAEGMSLSKETCTSLPNKTFIIPRNNKVKIIYMTPQGRIESREFLGAAAFVLQHELQHLDGITLEDLGLEIDDDFENASEEEKQEIINLYLDSLDMKEKMLQIDIDNDEEAKQIKNAAKFINTVQSGETKLISEEALNNKE